MKFLMMVLSALLVTSSAMATSLITNQDFTLSKVFVNGQAAERVVGQLHMDYVGQKITLNIYNDICGSMTAEPGQVTCLAMPVLLAKIEAPLTNSTLSCGSTIYQGLEDVAGIRTEIMVTDHNMRVCKDLRPSRVVVEVKTLDARTGQAVNYVLMQ